MPNRRAFTLIELITALVLAAMLLAAITGVLIQSHRQLNNVNQLASKRWEDSTIRIIRNDMQLASEIYIQDGWVWLIGEFPAPGNQGYVDQVGYGIGPWLPADIKQISGSNEQRSSGTVQSPTQKPVNSHPPSALIRISGNQGNPMVVGPNRLMIERLDDSGTPQPLSSKPTAIAKQLRLWIWLPNSDDPAITADLVAH